MNRPGQQFLAGSGFAGDENGRGRRADGFGPVQRLPKRRPLPDHRAEIVALFDFLNEILVFTDQLLAEPINLFVGPHVINGKGDLLCDLPQKLHISRIRFSVLNTADIERAQTRVAHQKRQVNHAAQPLLEIQIIFQERALRTQARPNMDLAMIVDPSDRAAGMWNDRVPLEHPRGQAGFKRIKSK